MSCLFSFARSGIVAIGVFASAVALADKLSVQLSPNPPKMGKQGVELALTDDNGKPIEGAKVEGEAIMPPTKDMEIMKSKIKWETQGSGKFSGKFNLSMEGAWYLKLSVANKTTSKNYFYKLATGISDAASVSEIPLISEEKSGSAEHDKKCEHKGKCPHEKDGKKCEHHEHGAGH